MIICSDGYNKESITQRFQVSTQFDSFTGIKTKYMVSWTTGSAWASLRFSVSYYGPCFFDVIPLCVARELNGIFSIKDYLVWGLRGWNH